MVYKVYKQTTSYTCGPCTYFTITETEHNEKLEADIHRIGGIKPSKIFLAPSFEIVAKYLGNKGKFSIYSLSGTLTERALSLMMEWEKIPAEKREEWKSLVKNNYDSLLKKSDFHKIKDLTEYFDVLKKFAKGHVLALMVMMPLLPGEPVTPHWVSVIKYDKGVFTLGHSSKGKEIKLTEEQLLENLHKLKEYGFPNQFVVYENTKSLNKV